jgi:hypothetical protein
MGLFRFIKELLVRPQKHTLPVEPMPLTTFHLFPKLPLELQRNIWEHSLSESRVVSIKRRGRVLEIPEGSKYFEEHYLITASYHIPGALHCTSESREVAKMKYTYCFEKQLQGKGIFFDFDRDMLYFTDQWALSAFYDMEVPDWPRENQRSRHYSLEIKLLHDSLRLFALHAENRDYARSVGILLNQFEKLEKVVIFGKDLKQIENYGKTVLTPYVEGNGTFGDWNRVKRSKELGNMPEISYIPSGAADEIKVDSSPYTTLQRQGRQMRLLARQRCQGRV